MEIRQAKRFNKGEIWYAMYTEENTGKTYQRPMLIIHGFRGKVFNQVKCLVISTTERFGIPVSIDGRDVSYVRLFSEMYISEKDFRTYMGSLDPETMNLIDDCLITITLGGDFPSELQARWEELEELRGGQFGGDNYQKLRESRDGEKRREEIVLEVDEHITEDSTAIVEEAIDEPNNPLDTSILDSIEPMNMLDIMSGVGFEIAELTGSRYNKLPTWDSLSEIGKFAIMNCRFKTLECVGFNRSGIYRLREIGSKHGEITVDSLPNNLIEDAYIDYLNRLEMVGIYKMIITPKMKVELNKKYGKEEIGYLGVVYHKLFEQENIVF